MHFKFQNLYKSIFKGMNYRSHLDLLLRKKKKKKDPNDCFLLVAVKPNQF